jgi:hypothetical protein
MNMHIKDIYKGTKHNLAIREFMKRVVKSDDTETTGIYHSIDLNLWQKIDFTRLSDNTINIGREYGNKDVWVFIQVEPEGRIDIKDNYKMYHKKDWIEYRKERGRKKFKNTQSQNTGVIWLGDMSETFGLEVYIEKPKGENIVD